MTTEQKTNTASTKEDTPDIDSLVDVLHSDVTDVDTGTAVDSIDEWIDFLKGHKEEGVKEISTSLKELKKLLKGKSSDASEIASVLSQLGEQTNAAGDSAQRGVKGPLHTVGKALISFSHKVEKMADKED
jgi:hypothetical protein